MFLPTFNFAHSTGGVLGLLPWFGLTRPHSTDSNVFTSPDQVPHMHPNATPEPQQSGPEPDSPTPRWTEEPRDDTIKKLMLSPTLFDPIRTPRYPIVLCHGGYSTFYTWWHFVYTGELLGLYGFDVRGPASFPRLQQHYWHNILSILRGKVGAEVIVTSVPS